MPVIPGRISVPSEIVKKKIVIYTLLVCVFLRRCV